jgi:hypothetical protein
MQSKTIEDKVLEKLKTHKVRAKFGFSSQTDKINRLMSILSKSKTF